jgi:VIT1/CCC1 family predicted Fe2+/Mn2+ transporter
MKQAVPSPSSTVSEIKPILLRFQRDEITEARIYRKLSVMAKSPHNREVLARIADEETAHYGIWKNASGVDVKPDGGKYIFYVLVSMIFGVTFGIKLMERGEKGAQESYGRLSATVPEAGRIQKEENGHENLLIGMIDEDKLKYMGSVVLGLNDALVEFTGALAGFTFALRDSRLIGMVGLIMGFSASLSMAASEYLSTKTEGEQKSPLKASIYTGVAYVFTVIALVLPYFVMSNCYISLALTIVFAVVLIYFFTFYYSVVKEIPFAARFIEMSAISLGVAALSFLIGLAVRNVLKVDI